MLEKGDIVLDKKCPDAFKFEYIEPVPNEYGAVWVKVIECHSNYLIGRTMVWSLKNLIPVIKKSHILTDIFK